MGVSFSRSNDCFRPQFAFSVLDIHRKLLSVWLIGQFVHEMRVMQRAVTHDFVHAMSFNTAADTVTGQRLRHLVQLDKTIQAVASINR